VQRDTDFMGLCLSLAEEAAAQGEVPVGAVVVVGGVVVGRGFNLRETTGDPTAHAEIVALREAARSVGYWRVLDSTLYVTLEPCAMCAGALVNARVSRLVYGCTDPKAGAVESLFSIPTDVRLNHRVEVTGGLCAEASAELLRRFFRQRRGRS
jgi:tRNA(adenine34) deaminase